MMQRFLVGARHASPLLVSILMLFTFSAATAQPDDYAGFRVVGRHLYDGAGEKVVLVGVNKMVIWTDIDGVPSFSEIARTGANAVRIVWLSSGTAEQLDTAITNAINEDLIPLVDCHDTTGDWSKLAACVDYWVRPDVLTVIRKHEPYLLINIANEADDGSLRDIDYKAGYELAIRRMRAANIRVPLVIDGQGYASRIDNLQKNAPYLMQVDPLQNVLFSIHLYWPSARFGANVDDLVTSELRESAEMGLPLIVGEFAYEAVGCVGEIPYRTIIEQAHLNEIGWFAWEWGPGNQDCSSLDMTEDGLFDTLHGWGLEVAITNPYSIQNVAVRPQSILNLEPVATGIEVPQPASDNLPDLVLTDIAWSPETPLHDAPVTFTATVENRGDAPTASSFSVTLWVNGERLEPFASDTPLESGGSVTVTGVWESAVAGNFIVAGWVDSDSTLDERDAHNNLLTTHGVVKLFASS